MNSEISKYNSSQAESDRKICERLSEILCENLIDAESKIWHSHPVWFLDGNPITGYSKQKKRNKTDVLERQIFQ